MAKIRLTVAYHQPPDADEFYRHYEDIHVPLGHKIPGVDLFEWAKVLPGPSGQTPKYAMFSWLTFCSMEQMGMALSSPEAQAAQKDMESTATNGADSFLSELGES
jgi:uncharacterized protein (TIGR02118 family)